MSKANLLLHLDSFIWKDLKENRAQLLDDLALAIVCINGNEDIVYNHPELYKQTLDWGELYEILYFNEEVKAKTCPWLTHDHQTTLAKLFGRSISPKPSKSLADLKTEFLDANNNWVGVSPIDKPCYVFDVASWTGIHERYISEYYDAIDKQSDYFKKLYVPKLRLTVSLINRSIDKGLEHPLFKRVDAPTVVQNSLTLHGEQIQIHFNDDGKSALNIDGTWKHGGFDLHTDLKDKLTEWGFKLPS